MIKEELYHKTIGILADAYFKNTLAHGDCCACGVGNLVASNMNLTITEELYWKNDKGEKVNNAWDVVFYTDSEFIQHLSPGFYNGKAKEQIDSTGYTWRQLAKIENAFETAEQGETEDDHMFNGLMAIVDVLGQIHKVNEQETSNSKSKFVKLPCAI